jgi:hypothetical protein
MNHRASCGLVVAALALAALGPCGCGNKTCTTDTNCKMPLVCLAGECQPVHAGDAVTDSEFDGDVQAEDGVPDEIDAPFDPRPDEPVDSPDTEGEAPHDIEPEDVEEEELPPATILWSEDFAGGAARWQIQSGSWSATGGEYVQSSNNSFAESWVPLGGEPPPPFGDFAAEVDVVATSTDTTVTRATLGLIFRVQQIERNYYYLCGIDFNGHKLVLVKYDQDVTPGYEDLCVAEALEPTPELETYYKLQVVAAGSTLTCRWLSEDVAEVQIVASDDQYVEGSIGLFANKVAGRFDNIVVYDHRPPEWPTAARRESCL